MEIRQIFLALSSVMATLRTTAAFAPLASRCAHPTTVLNSSPVSTTGVELTRNPDKKPSTDWELDCYSRPVVAVGGKKLWEVLITDATGSFRYLKTLPSNQVNSKELRATVEDLLEQSDVKPSTIRYFRGAMFNMIKIALSELDVVGRPSRCTYAVAQWLEERHRKVYPKMEG
jgi:RNA-binding protein Tab2/Atab2